MRFARGERVKRPSLPRGLTVDRLADSIRRPSYGDSYDYAVDRYSRQIAKWFDEAEKILTG